MGLDFFVNHSYLIPLLPLLGAIAAGFFGARWLKGNSHLPIWAGVGASALLSLGLLIAVINNAHAWHDHRPIGQAATWFTWIQAGTFRADAGAWVDPLTAVMLTVVCGIGFLITVFAAGYMKGEEGYFRFFAYLGLFIFAMTCLVMGENLIMLYLGWEGVGLCSYLLIGYYYDRPAAAAAAKKAFLVNRIGDFGFGVGIMLIFLAFGTVSFFGGGVGSNAPGLLELATMPLDRLRQVPGVNADWVPVAMQWVPFCLMLGAFGKSAQFPLYVWLPDAMEGPTPVSALIHAATMVTAGVYMIARCGTLFVQNEAAMITVAFVGAFTALLAATIALRQFDLKKVFAYSTVSQLGFMFAAVGALAPIAGVFHLVTHAFFKALLFLASGVVMHAMLGELDMRQMSGLKRVLPKTRWLMLIGCLALAGVPPLAGFWSKDEIIGMAWHQSKVLGLVLLLTAFLTAYYTFRLYFRVFHGPEVIPPEPGFDAHHAIDISGVPHVAGAMAGNVGPGAASAAAVQTGDTAHSGVDAHLQSDAHQAATAHGGHGGHGHGHGHHDHEPPLMIVPLVVLAIGALFAGSLNFHHALGDFLGRSPSLMRTHDVAVQRYNGQGGHEVNPVGLGQPDLRPEDAKRADAATHTTFMVVSTLVAAAGIALAYRFHLRDRAAGDALAGRFRGLAGALENKYWVDELYQAAVVGPLRGVGRAFHWIDRIVVEGLVWAVGFVPQFSGFALKLTTQRGYLQGYAGAMALGIVVILLIVLL
jgi:NADH-quinone oxidoreductase subunit L